MASTENSLSRHSMGKRSRLSTSRIVLLVTTATLVFSGSTQATEQSSLPSALEKTAQTTTKPRRVLLDVRVVEMRPSDLRKLGTWDGVTLRDDPSAVLHSNDADGSRDRSRIQAQVLCAADPASTYSLFATLNSLEKGKRLRVTANPQVVAVDGETHLLLKTFDNEWFFAPAEPNPCFDPRELVIKSSLTVPITPHIGDANAMTIEASVGIPDRRSMKRDTANNIVLRRTETHATTIQSGGTIAWAGITQYALERKRASGLARLPLIGSLFGKPKANKPAEETVILVTPSLIPQRH